jgi:alkylmercury lyase
MTVEPSTTPQLTTAAEAAERLNLGVVTQELPDAVSMLMARLLRRLAHGEPVSMADALDLAGELDRDEAQGILERSVERDDDGRVVGAVGLSLAGHPHIFKVGDAELTAWCAWDTFFLPQILGATAEVTSEDPVTGELIELTISPDQVVISPKDAVVSVVYPNREECDTPAAVQELFCGFVLFFGSVASAQRWFGERDIPAGLLTPDEAFVLGSMRFADLIAAGKALDEE